MRVKKRVPVADPAHDTSNVGLEYDWTIDQMLSDPRCTRWRQHMREHGVTGADIAATDAPTVMALHHRLHGVAD